jgi:hypothetical protein
MKDAIAFGAIGGCAVAMTAFVLSAGLVPALLFGLLAGVPALVLVATVGNNPTPALAPYRPYVPAAIPTPAAVPAVDARDEDDYDLDDWEDTYGYCTPSRRATLTASRVEPEVGIVPDLAPAVELVPDLAPIAVGDWPTRQTVEAPAVVEPELVPVVVNRTAARFGSLEIKRD